MTEIILKKVIFDLLVPSANMEEVGLYDLYCSQPPGGDRDTLASLLGSPNVVHLYIQHGLHVLPSLVEVEEEQQLISEAGELMGGGEGSGGGEKGGAGAQIWDQRVHSLVERGEEGERE